MNSDLIFGISFIICIAFFFVGLWIGMTHNNSTQAQLLIMRQNIIIKTISEWVLQNKHRMVQELLTHNRDMYSLPEKIVNEIDKQFTIKTLK